MLIAVTTEHGNVVARLVDGRIVEADAHSDVEPKDGPSPIAPELKELAWGGGAFVVLAILMRFVLYPRMRKGMDARRESIRSGLEAADAARQAAATEVADYQAELAKVRAEASSRVDAARQTLEAERQQRLTEANARIAERRAEELARVDAQRAAAEAQVQQAVAELVSRTTELATGRHPDDSVVAEAVASSMSVGVGR